MNTVNKALIGVLIGQIVLAVIMISRADENRLRKLELIVPEFNAEAIERIDVYKRANGDGPAPTVPDLNMVKENGIWVVKNYFDFPVDPDNVKTLLEKVENLASRGSIASGETRRIQLSVTANKFERQVQLFSAGVAEPLTLYIGKAAGGRKIAVRKGGDETIHGIARFGPSSAQYAVLAWVDSTYFEASQHDIVGIEVSTAAGRWNVRRTGPKELWRLVDAPQDDPNGAIAAPQPDVAMKYLVQRPFDNIARQMALVKFNEPANPQIPRGSPLAEVTLTVAPKSDDPAVPTTEEKYSFVIGPEQDGKFIVSRENARPVWIYANNFESIVNLSEAAVYSDKPQPNFKKGRSQPKSKIPIMGVPANAPHGGAPAGGGHGGGAPAGGGHGGGAPAGGAHGGGQTAPH